MKWGGGDFRLAVVTAGYAAQFQAGEVDLDTPDDFARLIAKDVEQA
jgi:hypothetical protein